MTAGRVLAGAPSSGAVHAVAPSVYREVVTGSNACRSASYHGAFERLELCEGKLSCTVLRGRGASNGPLLPDRIVRSEEMERCFKDPSTLPRSTFQ